MLLFEFQHTHAYLYVYLLYTIVTIILLLEVYSSSMMHMNPMKKGAPRLRCGLGCLWLKILVQAQKCMRKERKQHKTTPNQLHLVLDKQ